MLLTVWQASGFADLARGALPQALLIVYLMLPKRNCQVLNDTQTSICLWSQMRIAPVRDVLFIDGGQRFESTPDAQPSFLYVDHTLFAINFTARFDTSKDNLTELFTPVPTGPENLYPSFYSGFMFTDEYDFYTYGGLVSQVVLTPPPADYINGYDLYEEVPNVVTPTSGPLAAMLSDSVTRYVTDGAGVSVPSEKSAFYLGGMTNLAAEFDDYPVVGWVPSKSLIQMNMSTPGLLKSSNHSLPDFVVSRADAQLLWLPVSSRGLLVLVGGVVNPENLFGSLLNTSQIIESEIVSPSFMSTIQVYDVASSNWYSQDVTGKAIPGPLSSFCSVVATEDGSSSYDIYIYGGYNGIRGPGVIASMPSDDVWVLSIPSFTWTKVYDGNRTSGRSFHSCVNPYPEQMWVLGGQGVYDDSCVEPVIKIFNLNALVWQDIYDPTVYDASGYKRPAQILQTIKDLEDSGAIINGLPASMSPKLQTAFDTPYDGVITVYYPYAQGSSLSSKIKVSLEQAFASWLSGILGVVLYLLLSTICITSIVIIRRRMLLRRYGAAPLVSTAVEKSHFIRWINNMKVASVEEETLMNEGEDAPSKLKSPPANRKTGLVRWLFSRTQKSEMKRRRTLLGRQEKSPASGEVYELRTRQFDGAGYNHVSTDQAEEDGGIL